MQSIVIIALFFLSALALAKGDDLKYCIPVEKVNFNPFREIVDGKDLAYLMLLRSYISTDTAELGILSSYEFSPDGKIFTGKLTPNLTWSDGAKVTPLEAAFGIAKTLTFRSLGQRVRVVGTEEINSSGWEKRNYSGIEILNEDTFRLNFDSKIENLNGVMREALSTNSRHNRFWPIQISGFVKNKKIKVLAKFPQGSADSDMLLNVFGEDVRIVNSSNCSDPDFSIFPESIDLASGNFAYQLSPSPSAITLQPNTKRLNLTQRRDLVGWVRSSFDGLDTALNTSSVPSFFLQGESGYTSDLKWQKQFNLNNLKAKKIKIAYEIPFFKTILEPAVQKSGLKIEFVALPSSDSDIDAQILASGIQNERHIILQDVLKWPFVKDFMQNAPLTKKSLIKIAIRSASTLPPDLETLRKFEKDALTEQALAPVARKYAVAYSNKNLKICLSWSKKGELTFSKKEKCIF